MSITSCTFVARRAREVQRLAGEMPSVRGGDAAETARSIATGLHPRLREDMHFSWNARFADRISGRKTGLHPRLREGMFFSWKCSISRRDPSLFNLILTADEPDDG
jgi:hypothetical protein